jgi:hypothetical protein
VGPFLLAFQEKIQKFWQRILAVFSVAILSSGSCGVAGLRAIPVGWGHTRHAHPQ